MSTHANAWHMTWHRAAAEQHAAQLKPERTQSEERLYNGDPHALEADGGNGWGHGVYHSAPVDGNVRCFSHAVSSSGMSKTSTRTHLIPVPKERKENARRVSL